MDYCYVFAVVEGNKGIPRGGSYLGDNDKGVVHKRVFGTAFIYMAKGIHGVRFGWPGMSMR
ncbi:hypothetical protein M406DRAFT_102912 [Cryphonectria parasitica EP155]|uniref:Uncharacterized protein n=1 Tax=Cryphonectria parasitica (strain ATCC 38755 / EP155) TaxID=660469 RepID=A0A9P5CT15_CRYP1|nr:uncharacterized protein M406DRAFT_102912 [Cryphonectria parasitica EP155]KAF3768936.1 hypothetical protein M406DRAFT_102912 [Cryphonectria parasitica EP155]